MNCCAINPQDVCVVSRVNRESYRVTKLHTRGVLAGMTTEEITPVHFFAGRKITNAIGGGDYIVLIVEQL